MRRDAEQGLQHGAAVLHLPPEQRDVVPDAV